MPNYRHVIRPGGTYFFTLVTERRAPIFEDAGARQILRHALQAECARRPFTIDAIVLLPDHLHMVMTMPEGNANFWMRLSAIKSAFTRMYLESGGTEQRCPASRRRQQYRGVWQRRFWEHLIRDDTDQHAHFDYIHYNPVKHGLVSCPHKWPRSSFDRHVQLGNYESTWQCICGDRQDIMPDFSGIACNE